MPLQIDNAKGELVVDPYRMKEYWFRWKQERLLKGISETNATWIRRFLEDMELGINVCAARKRGPRSYRRLVDLKRKMRRMAVLIEEHLGLDDLTKLTERDIISLFTRMRTGEIRTHSNRRYTAAGDMVKDFKTFWHWYMAYAKKERKQLIEDIGENLDGSKEKPSFVYFTYEDMQRMADQSKYKYKVLLYFLFDSGIRSPSELVNVKRKDITSIPNSDFLWLNIREETSKTFGRKIKLLLCHRLLKEYIRNKSPEDFIFPICHTVANRYLQRLAERVLGKKGLTMYDFRHAAACYWVTRYKSESALKYRFGWKRSDKIIYYTEFLGMKDTIQEDDLYLDIPKPQLEQELELERNKRALVTEELEDVRQQLQKINSFMNKLVEKNPEVIDMLASKAKELPEKLIIS